MTARSVMFANASFSAASAVFILAARNTLTPLFALDSPVLLIGLAAALVLYAGALVIEARREPPDRRALLTAAILDAGWVLGSAVVLVLAWTELAPLARVLIIVAAVIVELFATLQFRAARSIAVGVDR
jgi:CHASE2 domain-containing sensor protein